MIRRMFTLFILFVLIGISSKSALAQVINSKDSIAFSFPFEDVKSSIPSISSEVFQTDKKFINMNFQSSERFRLFKISSNLSQALLCGYISYRNGNLAGLNIPIKTMSVIENSMGVYNVSSTPATGAAIIVDGVQSSAFTDDLIGVTPGRHLFEAKLEGYISEPKEIIVQKGVLGTITFELTTKK